MLSARAPTIGTGDIEEQTNGESTEAHIPCPCTRPVDQEAGSVRTEKHEFGVYSNSCAPFERGVYESSQRGVSQNGTS